MSLKDTGQIIEGKQFSEPYVQSEELIGNFEILMAQHPFLIDRADCQTLTRSGHSSVFLDLGINVAAGALTVVFTIFVRYLFYLHHKLEIQIYSWELVVCAALFILSLILFAIDYCFTSPKRELVRKMNSHFEASPRSVASKKRKT
ncbi:MAG: hypothetical protein ABL984_12540 [Pyrinomonadaceae bacterium]